MSTMDINTGQIAAHAGETERAAFIRRTYMHVAGALLALAALLFVFIQTGIAASFTQMIAKMGGGYFWLIIMGLYMGVSFIANKWAHSGVSKEIQYAGLAFYVVATAIVFCPAIYMGMIRNPGLLPQAVLVTAALAGGITFTAFTTKKNFSFLGSIVKTGMFVLVGIIVASILFGFQLGLLFLGAGILLMGASLLYDTSNVIHEYRTTQHVAASLSLFGSISFLFYYVMQFMGMSGD